MADEQIRIGLAVVSDAGTQKTLNDLAAVRKRIEALKTEFRSGAKDVDTYTKELAALEKEANKLDKTLDGLGETRRINIETNQLEDPTKGSLGARAQAAGSALRNLPSVQIPGLGIGTDAIANIIRVGGALADKLAPSAKAAAAAVETGATVSKAAAATQTGLAAAETAVGASGAAGAVGVGALAAAILPIAAPILAAVAAVAAVGVAFKNFSDESAKRADELNQRVEAQRKTNDLIANGATTEELTTKLNNLKAARDQEQATLDRLKATYDANYNTGTLLAAGAKVLTHEEEALNDQIRQSTENVNSLTYNIDDMSDAIDKGAAAANDRAEQEKKAAAERTQNALDEAAQAGELAALRARAGELTQEQIDKELEALEIRRTSTEAQIASLEASGDTSEEVADKIRQLKESLGFLGEQADVLNKARGGAKSSEAEKAAEKARKDAEREAERAAKEEQKRIEDTAKAHQTYADKVKDVGTRFKDAVKDIGTSLNDNLADNLRKLDTDLREDTIKFNQDQLKDERKFQADLSNLKRQAERAEKDAVKTRDFVALANARQQAADALGERQSAEDFANQEDLIAFQQHRAELNRAKLDADRDDSIAQERALRDAKIQRDRSYRDAATDRDRSLRDIGGLEQNYQRQSLNNWQTYFNQLLGMQGQLTSKSGNAGSNFNTPTKGQRATSGSIFDILQYTTVVGS